MTDMYFNQKEQQIRKIKEVQKEIETAKATMEDTVENLINRAELLEQLDTTTKDLRNQDQEFILNGNDLKIKFKSRNHMISGAIMFAFLGVAYGLVHGQTKEGAAIGAIIAGGTASTFGAALGHYFGDMLGFVERKWYRLTFAYEHFRPTQALREKINSLYMYKMKCSTENAKEILLAAKNQETDNNHPISFTSHHEQRDVWLLGNSRTLTPCFETKKQVKADLTAAQAETNVAFTQARSKL